MSEAQEMLMQIEQRYVQTQQQLQSVKAQIASGKREMQLADATKRELQQENPPHVWETVGKMFIKTGLQDHLNKIDQDKKSVQESLEALDKKQTYLETTNKNLTDTVNELMKRNQ